jgi:1-acyl-sn-glycerol-3-phosphate acyltransferase
MPQPPLANPSSRWARLAGNARATLLAIVLFSALIGFNVLQMMSTLLIPLSRQAFRRLNRWAANTWWGWTVSVARLLYGAAPTISGDDVPPRENAIVVANHQQMPDICFLMHLAVAKDRLGDMKWFVKHALKNVPGLGWGMQFLDCPFVRRRWTEDQQSIEATFARLVRDQVPMWLMTFPEGTRVTPAKVERSQAYAAERGLWQPKEVLLPRTKGFVATVNGLRSVVDAVYDVTIAYESGVPNLWQYACGYAPHAYLHVRRFPLDELPDTDAGLAAWLMERFQEKDQRLQRYMATGSLDDTSQDMDDVGPTAEEVPELTELSARPAAKEPDHEAVASG